MKIAIIGAGASGLVSLKYALDDGHQCDVFEQTGVIGGIWVYTDKTGTDENGLPLHTSMYHGLRTNLPKEVMAFLDFPYPEMNKSYLGQPEVLKYFNDYADRFNLRQHIKFSKYVTKVSPLPGEKWSVTYQDAKTKEETSQNYDAVMVCNGHYRVPFIPQIPGKELFKGLQDHSHNYRVPEPYSDKKVLVIGAGPSGADIARFISKVSDHVYISFRKTLFEKYLDDVIKKPEVVRFDETGANFADGTREEFDVILYCTGYKYDFPFLTQECGIKVDNNWVNPLHKHIINIEHPTMCFVGIPFVVCVIPLFDIQARFALASLAGKFSLPSKEEMLKGLHEFVRLKEEIGIPKKLFHQIGRGDNQSEYFDYLSTTANIRRIPPVVSKIYNNVVKSRTIGDYYKIIDDENYECISQQTAL